jgi:hypothetical protein
VALDRRDQHGDFIVTNQLLQQGFVISCDGFYSEHDRAQLELDLELIGPNDQLLEAEAVIAEHERLREGFSPRGTKERVMLLFADIDADDEIIV